MSADFVIVGSRTADGRVTLHASAKVASGGRPEPVQRMVPSEIFEGEDTYLPGGWMIRVFTDDVVNVDGETYAEALAILMAIWGNQARAGEPTPVAELFRARD
jgi:hypothetical protein